MTERKSWLIIKVLAVEVFKGSILCLVVGILAWIAKVRWLESIGVDGFALFGVAWIGLVLVGTIARKPRKNSELSPSP